MFLLAYFRGCLILCHLLLRPRLLRTLFTLLFSYPVSFSLPGNTSQRCQTSEGKAEGSETMRVPGVPGQGEGRGDPD